MVSKHILVVGATGRQGLALIHALRPAGGEEEPEFHVLALTRNTKSPSALSLVGEKHVTVVEGDLETPHTIKAIFNKPDTKIWGVFCVLAYPGLGTNADGEERQGKMLADLALEHHVSLYVYSSNDRGKEASDEIVKFSDRSKALIERHVRSLGDKGLPWCIIRPGVFMENYQGTIGSVTAATFSCGLKPNTTLQLIAADDIGRVAANIFRNPAPAISQIVLVVSERLTMSQQQAAFKEATGHNLTSLPRFTARLIIALNKSVKDLMADLERKHTEYVNGDCPAQDDQMKLAHTILPDMLTFKEWASQQKSTQSQQKKGWNQISLLRLLLGRQ